MGTRHNSYVVRERGRKRKEEKKEEIMPRVRERGEKIGEAAWQKVKRRREVEKREAEGRAEDEGRLWTCAQKEEGRFGKKKSSPHYVCVHACKRGGGRENNEANTQQKIIF